ncbi:MAG: glycosyltransferase [Pseudobacter sp.]|uniref:glycosyltransferase n=1 Tax=Pseudobacter sp. TaxID=2045420 RepID=UPI003F7DE87A
MVQPAPDTIIIITPAFPRNESEDWWVPSQQLLVQSMQRQFPEMYIVILPLLYPKEITSYEWHGCQVKSIHGLRFSKLLRPLRWRKAWQELTIFRKQHNIKGIVSFWCGECAAIGHWFGRRHGIRHISWICGQDAEAANQFPRYLRLRSTELAAMSHFLADNFTRNHGIRPAYIIPNAVDTASFPHSEQLVRDIDIAGVGSLEPLKRYPLWVELVATLQQSIPDINAVHYGMGVEQEHCQQLIAQYQLEQHCKLAGPQPHNSILRALQRTKILLHTSRYEGCSTVCLEALYAGAKVISFTYPFQQPVSNWHVVTTKEEMLERAHELLQDATLEYQSTLIHSMDASAREMMRLFGYAQSLAPPRATAAL